MEEFAKSVRVVVFGDRAVFVDGALSFGEPPPSSAAVRSLDRIRFVTNRSPNRTNKI